MSKTPKRPLLVEVETENIIELRVLLETLKDVLHDTNVSFIADTEPIVASNQETQQHEEEPKTEKNKNSEDHHKEKKHKHKDSKKQKKQEETPQQNEENKDEQQKDGEKKPEKGGIKIMTFDEQKTLLIFVKLDAKQFLKFNVKRPVVDAGIDLTQLYKFFRSIKEGILSINIDEDNEHYIMLNVYNDEQKSSNEYKLKLMDLNNRIFKLPPQKFTMTVTMDCGEFHRLCRELNQISEHMEITCTSKKITFSSSGDSASNIRTYENCNGRESNKGVKIRCTNKDASKVEIVRAIFALKNLVMFNKCTNLCTEIQLFLKNEYPLFIDYSVATLGHMTIGIVPVDEKTIHKTSQNNYDNIHYDKTQINVKED